MTRYRVCEASFVAHPAPNHAPRRLPASKLTMTDQCAATDANGTAAARNGRAEATTIKLMALLRITAWRAGNRNAPISSGKRNSAPPRPIRPPSAPMTAPPAKAVGALRFDGRFVAGMVAPGAMFWEPYRPVSSEHNRLAEHSRLRRPRSDRNSYASRSLNFPIAIEGSKSTTPASASNRNKLAAKSTLQTAEATKTPIAPSTPPASIRAAPIDGAAA